MKQDKPQRRASQQTRRPSTASAILSGKGRVADSEDYTSISWLLLFGTFLLITLISFLFTPFTHQLDEIKNVLLMFGPPILLVLALLKMDFSSITWKRHGSLILFALYFLWMIISWAVNPYKLMGERVIWFNLGVGAFTVIFAWFLDSENKVRKTMIFFVTLGFISTILGLFLYAGRFTQGFYDALLEEGSQSRWATLFYTLFNSHGDMYSFILNSDFYAAFLVMLIPIALSMFFVEQRTGFKVLALLSVLLMNVCLFLTNSNDSFISMFLFAYPLYFLLGWKYVKEWGLSRRFVLSFAGLTAIILLAVVILMWPKLSATYDFKTNAFEGRRVLWGGGFWPWIYGDNLHGERADLISVIFGTGPGGYRHYFPWFRRPDFFDQQINNVTTFGHNFYLDVLLETGVVGLILFIGFHVRVVADGIRQIRTTQSRTHLLYQLAVIIGLAGIAVQNYSSPNNRWAVAGMTYWCMFGLSMGLFYLENPGQPGENAERRIGNIPIYKLAKYSCMFLAVVFFVRCVIPGFQFGNYWSAARANADGLRYMESASYPGLSPEQRLQFLNLAKTEFEQAIEDNPTFATSYYKLGHVYNQLGMSDTAIKTYEELDQINPNYSEVHLNLGIMYAQKAGDLPQRLQEMQAETASMLTEMQAASGARRDSLEQEYGEKLEQMKSLGSNLAERRIELMETAYKHMKEASHQSKKPNTQYLTGSIGRELVMMYEEAGEKDKADAQREEIKKYFRSLIEYQPKLEELQVDQKEYYSKAQRQLLALAEETGNIDESIEVLKGMVKDNPDNDIILQALLEAYDRGNKTEGKLKYLEDAVHADPTDAALRLELATAYQKAGQQQKYINELRRVEVLQPKDTVVLGQLQAAYTEAGNDAKAKEYDAKLTTLEASTTATATGTTSTAAGTVATEATTTAAAAAEVAETTTPTVLQPGTTPVETVTSDTQTTAAGTVQ